MTTDITFRRAVAGDAAALALVGQATFLETFSGILDGAAIIQVSSGLTRYTYPGQLAYAAAKSAFETAMRYLAVELGPRGITANIVAPGGVVTDFGGGYLREPSLAAAVTEQTPLGRVAQPDDIGEIVAAIATMPWATGQRIEATGGFKL